jgi:hypothetical protein
MSVIEGLGVRPRILLQFSQKYRVVVGWSETNFRRRRRRRRRRIYRVRSLPTSA